MPTDAALNQYLDFLRFGSISTDSKYKDQVLGCADWVKKKLISIGFKAVQHETPGHPIIVGHGPRKEGRPTVLIYGHYDVQPVDPLDLWNRPPFNPGIENGIVTARGASDNKGQIFAHILGLEQVMKEKGDLPVNVIVVVEGEEEIGSPNLAPFLDTQRESLACDVVVISDSSMVAPGQPTFTYGLRGLAAVEVTATGPDHDLHSGIFGGAVENPVTVLARLVAGLHDKNLKVRIEGFYEHVKPLAPWERKAWKHLPLRETDLLRMTGAPALRGEKRLLAARTHLGTPHRRGQRHGRRLSGRGNQDRSAQQSHGQVHLSPRPGPAAGKNPGARDGLLPQKCAAVGAPRCCPRP